MEPREEKDKAQKCSNTAAPAALHAAAVEATRDERPSPPSDATMRGVFPLDRPLFAWRQYSRRGANKGCASELWRELARLWEKPAWREDVNEAAEPTSFKSERAVARAGGSSMMRRCA